MRDFETQQDGETPFFDLDPADSLDLPCTFDSPSDELSTLQLATWCGDEPPPEEELAKMMYCAEIELTADDCAFLWSCGIQADKFEENWLTIDLA
jgi:hypothetical protein